MTSSLLKYESRLNDLCAFTTQHYGLDQLHCRLLCATLLPLAAGVEPTWLLAESPFHKFWDHLNLSLVRMGLPPILSHYDLYTLRPRTMRDTYKEILESRHLPRVMVDSHWHEPVPYYVNPRSMFPLVRGQFVRVRIPLPVTVTPPVGAEMELGRLLNLVVDREHRDHSPAPMQLNGVLENLCTLLTLLNPELKGDANSLTRNVVMLPPSYAVLHGRGSVTGEDHMILLHVLRCAVRQWTARILECFGFATSRNGMVGGMEEGEGDAWTVAQLTERTGLPRVLVHRECDRLAWEGVVDWPQPKGKWKGNRPKYIRLSKEWGMEVRGLMQGEVRWW